MSVCLRGSLELLNTEWRGRDRLIGLAELCHVTRLCGAPRREEGRRVIMEVNAENRVVVVVVVAVRVGKKY